MKVAGLPLTSARLTPMKFAPSIREKRAPLPERLTCG